ncbi:MAG TPA: hypothetical protein VFG53_01080 [Anaeromyxobacter sp.]|nr:hypothetical protein [Anaeromyxobacter sp.]
MSRKEKTRPRLDKLAALLLSGDHREATRIARAWLADPARAGEERTRASAVLASLAPEPSAAIAGAVGVVAALAIGIWACLGGGR